MSRPVGRPPARLSIALLAWALFASVVIVAAVHSETRARANAAAQTAAARDVDRLVRRAADGLHLALAHEDLELAASFAHALVEREPDLVGLRIDLDRGESTAVGRIESELPHREHTVLGPDPDAELLLLGERLPGPAEAQVRRLGSVTAYVEAPDVTPLAGPIVSPVLGLALGAVILGSLAIMLWIRSRVLSLAEVAGDIAGGRFDDVPEIRGNDEVAWASMALGELKDVMAEHVDRMQGRNAALLRDVTIQEDRLDRLGAFAATLVAPLADDRQLDHALSSLHDGADAAFSLLFVPQPDDPSALCCEAAVGVPEGPDDLRLRAGWFAEGLAPDSGEDVQQFQLLDPEHPWMTAARRVVPCEGAAAVRLRWGGRLEGVAIVARHTRLSDADRSFLTDAALPFAIALANRRAYSAVVAMKRVLEERNDELLAQSDQLQVVDRVRSQFVANMSHELRTPLNAILGFTELLADGAYGGVTQQQLTPLHNVLEASQNLLTLVNQVLDLSRAEAGELLPDLSRCDVRDIAHEVVRLAEPACRQRPYTPQVIGPSAFVETDAGWVRQILTNLVGNAIKFTVEGSVVVRVVPEFGGGCQLVVEDTGVGIDPAQMELIFDEFHQADGSSTRAHDGVGLGLAISRRLARAVGGSLTVTSEPGGGSRFTLGLPACPITAGDVRQAS